MIDTMIDAEKSKWLNEICSTCTLVLSGINEIHEHDRTNDDLGMAELSAAYLTLYDELAKASIINVEYLGHTIDVCLDRESDQTQDEITSRNIWLDNIARTCIATIKNCEGASKEDAMDDGLDNLMRAILFAYGLCLRYGIVKATREFSCKNKNH